jgi:ATP-dependent RNA helicase DDX10/DBP4
MQWRILDFFSLDVSLVKPTLTSLLFEDRILDMGFRDQMMRILDYLPTERQTMLFSATQTKKVSDLAALSLKQPEYLGVHDNEKSSTPETLQQSLVVVPLEHKLNAIYSFVKSHLKNKTIVFMASCSQVRHAWELFCSLQPGIPIMALHGKLVQEKRTKIYFEFLNKPHAVLFATDVAARGLDFPNVDWVVQSDAPEDKEMYIHRAGRTARFKSKGKALLMVTPGEEVGFMTALREAKIPIKKLALNPTKTVLVTQRASSLVAANPKLNELAKKAFKSYVRSIYLMPNKEIFSVKDLPLEEYASSLGLASTPSVRFIKDSSRETLRDQKNVNHKLHKLKEQIKAEKLAKRIEKLGGRPIIENKRPLDDDDEDDDLLVVKKKHAIDDDQDLPNVDVNEVTRSRKSKRIRIDGSNGENKRIVFGDDGAEEAEKTVLESVETDTRVDDLEAANADYMQKVRERLQSTMAADLAEEKDRIREKHRKKRMKEKANRSEEDGEPIAILGNDDDVESSGDDDNASSDGDENSSSDSEESDDDIDVKTQEELALAVIRGI